MNLTPTNAKLFFSKNDSADPRLGDLSKCLTLKEFTDSSRNWGLVGYPDDEGISLGGGRPGAALGPDQIRTFFYKMTPSLFSPTMEGIADLGNVFGVTLSERHALAKAHALECFKAEKKLASLGGGHDYAYADVSAFLEVFKEQNPLIINIDAHLDVRPVETNLNCGLTSGTPFFRILNEFESGYDFVEVGIQPQCNSQNHLLWAQNHGTHVIFLDEIWQKGLTQSLEPFLKETRPVFLSLDIDGLTSSEAPGCSQSWTTGIKTQELLQFLQVLHSRLDIRGLGIYEVSPPLDQDHRTSKLAALILHHLIYL